MPTMASVSRAIASASANCGMTLGGTNDVTSISLTPAAASARHQAIFRSVGMNSLSELQAVTRTDFAKVNALAHGANFP